MTRSHCASAVPKLHLSQPLCCVSLNHSEARVIAVECDTLVLEAVASIVPCLSTTGADACKRHAQSVSLVRNRSLGLEDVVHPSIDDRDPRKRDPCCDRCALRCRNRLRDGI